MPFSSVENAKRHANDRIATRAITLGFVVGIPLACECADPACSDLVVVDPDEYRRARREGRPLVAPPHAVPLSLPVPLDGVDDTAPLP